MRKYCEECGKEVETKVITKKEVYDVCGESIEVDAQILVCAECGEEFYCEELDKARDLIRQHWVLDKEKEEPETDANTDEDAGETDPNAPTGPWEGSGY